MRQTTIGRLLLERALPPSFLDKYPILDKKTTAALFQELADKYPDQYKPVAKRLIDTARQVINETGGFSFGLEHISTAKAARKIHAEIEAGINKIRNNPMLNRDDKESAVIKLLQSKMKPLEDAVYEESIAENNPLALMVKSGARGNRLNLKSLRGGDLLYIDHKNRPIPIPVLSPYSRGLRPAEYWAATYGARKGVWDVKSMTAKAGYFGKVMTNAAHDLVVTGDDYPDDGEDRTNLGLPTETDDPDNIGSFLARPVGGYSRNTLLSKKVIDDLKNQGVKKILVRSPLVGGPADGGVYARDLGIRERGGLSPRGDMVGIAAVQALGERASQSMLSSKHSGGVAGATAATSGYSYLNSLLNPPKLFPGAATHVQNDGIVQTIREAPQGGHYVIIGGVEHYVPHGQMVIVKPGDDLEAGTVISDGIPDPHQIIKHKGLGEARRHFTQAFLKGFKDSDMPASRRNIELLARGLYNYVKFTGFHDDYDVDDIVPYNILESKWIPREGTQKTNPSQAIGKYLEKPVLHHTVGTKITKSMIPEFKEFGISDVFIHDKPPPFHPVLVRGVDLMQHHPDWLTRHLGGNVRKSTLDAVAFGRDSDESGTSFVPALAERLHFGRQGLTKSWKPSKKPALEL